MKISELEDADQWVTKAYLDARLAEFKAENSERIERFQNRPDGNDLDEAAFDDRDPLGWRWVADPLSEETRTIATS